MMKKLWNKLWEKLVNYETVFWCADDFGRLGQLWSVYPIMGDGLQDGYSRFLGSCCFVCFCDK